LAALHPAESTDDGPSEITITIPVPNGTIEKRTVRVRVVLPR
jgi:hypothetical protein